MGTRADFYVKKLKSETPVWKGSIAFDGYAIDKVENAKTVNEFEELLTDFLSERDDATIPEKHGWPWPWKNSKLTDEVWVFIEEDENGNGRLWRSYDIIGKYEDVTAPILLAPADEQIQYTEDARQDVIPPKESIELILPDMSGIQNVAMNNRSGLIIISPKRK